VPLTKILGKKNFRFTSVYSQWHFFMREERFKMNVNYDCKIEMARESEEFKEAVYFIFEFDVDNKTLESLVNNIVGPMINIPMEPIQGLKYLGASCNYFSPLTMNIPKIEIKSNFEITLKTENYYLQGEFKEKDLKDLGINNLKELEKGDFPLDVLFTNKVPAALAQKNVYYIPGSNFLEKIRSYKNNR